MRAVVVASLLSSDELERGAAAHRNVLSLKRDAPAVFTTPPSDEAIFSDEIVLRGDLGLPVVRGRAAYLEAFSALRQAAESPLVPLEFGALNCSFEPESERLLVRWRAPLRVGNAAAGRDVELSGLSTYEIDGRGQLSSHLLSDLRVGGRQLPSSTIGSWLEVLQARGQSSPASSLMLLMETLAAAREAGDAPPPAPGGEAATESAARCDAPPPGSDAWVSFESRQRLLLELLDGFDALLTREPSLARYAEGVELRAETDEVLVTGRSQYAQLLGALRGLHSTLAASPLLQHTFEFELLDDDGDGGAPPTEARVAWRYALQGAGSGARVATLEATSAFELEADGDNGLVVVRHKLRELQLNGRAALPAPLLRQLRRAQADAPELVKLLSAALLVVSDRGLAPAAPRPPPAAAAAPSGAPSPQFAPGYVRLLKSLHAQLPFLLTDAPALDDVCAANVEVKGLLREPLLQGRQPLGAALGALRRLFSAGESALTLPDDAVKVAIEVEPTLAIVVRWELSVELGAAEAGRAAPRVALPARIVGEARLQPDARDAIVREVWVRQLSVNGQPLLPKRLAAWVGRAEGGGPSSPADFLASLRDLVSA